MTVSVGSSPDNAFENALEAQRQKKSTDSSLQLPNVFVTPPEEEFDSPPWCCFDADRDAQPGEFVNEEDLENQDFDYAAHAEDEIFGGGARRVTTENGEKEDVFVMRSLMQEAEHLRERLKSLDLSAGSFSFTAPLPAEDDELYDELTTTSTTATATFSADQADQKIKRRKSLFSFRPLTRRKSFDENPSDVPFPSTSVDGQGEAASSDQGMDVVSIRTASSRKSSFFSRFKFSKKPATENNLEARKSISVCRSHEDLTSTHEQDVALRRRFSFFGRRPSFSAQRTITTTAPSIMPSMNQSNSSLSTSSVPPTPDAGIYILDSPPSSPTEKSNDRMPSVDASIMSTMDALAVGNIAASLTLSSSHTFVPDGQFTLDPLHFESLQFDSDDFA